MNCSIDYGVRIHGYGVHGTITGFGSLSVYVSVYFPVSFFFFFFSHVPHPRFSTRMCGQVTGHPGRIRLFFFILIPLRCLLTYIAFTPAFNVNYEGRQGLPALGSS